MQKLKDNHQLLQNVITHWNNQKTQYLTEKENRKKKKRADFMFKVDETKEN